MDLDPPPRLQGAHSQPTLPAPVATNYHNGRRRILALSGGGVRGLYTCTVLARLCEKLDHDGDLRTTFDVFAGTSIGSLIACGLAVGRSPVELASAISEHAPKIFQRPLWADLRRTVWGTPYREDALEDAVTAVLGQDAHKRLKDLDVALIVPAVSWTTGQVQVFLSKPFGQAASDHTLIQACRASAAAPTYFRHAQLASDVLLDGGLVANAPDALALLRCYGRWPESVRACEMLSIGTAGPSWQAQASPNPPEATLALAGPLVSFLMAAQERLALLQAQSLLGDNYLRIDRPLTQPIRLDEADDAALQRLREAGQQSADQALRDSRPTLDRLFG